MSRGELDVDLELAKHTNLFLLNFKTLTSQLQTLNVETRRKSETFNHILVLIAYELTCYLFN